MQVQQVPVQFRGDALNAGLLEKRRRRHWLITTANPNQCLVADHFLMGGAENGLIDRPEIVMFDKAGGFARGAVPVLGKSENALHGQEPLYCLFEPSWPWLRNCIPGSSEFCAKTSGWGLTPGPSDRAGEPAWKLALCWCTCVQGYRFFAPYIGIR